MNKRTRLYIIQKTKGKKPFAALPVENKIKIRCIPPFFAARIRHRLFRCLTLHRFWILCRGHHRRRLSNKNTIKTHWDCIDIVRRKAALV